MTAGVFRCVSSIDHGTSNYSALRNRLRACEAHSSSIAGHFRVIWNESPMSTTGGHCATAASRS